LGGSAFFRGQGLHLVGLALLLAAAAAATRLPGCSDGELLGLSTRVWFWTAVWEAVAHQVYVWVCWRLELGSRTLTRVFGAWGFPLYQLAFTALIVARPFLALMLAVSNAGTLPVDRTVARALAVAALVPAAYLGYSVARYFGLARAYGADHFDPAYRTRGLVQQGIFRLSPNAMYVFGFLLLWAPGLWFRSTAALVFAAFSHAYIWVHYYATERPDMQVLYGSPPAS
jgi:protein-S-isoprenylcysteine O-methyltransferase Ste14